MNKTVLRRYTIEGVEPALLKSPKLLGKGNLNLSALINKLAEAEGQEPETYETWIGEPFASCLVYCGNDLFGDNAVSFIPGLKIRNTTKKAITLIAVLWLSLLRWNGKTVLYKRIKS